MADVVQELLREIETEIAGARTATARQGVGVIREIGDGVARVEGLADAMLNEMLDFGGGITGLALNLDETEVGVIVLGDYTKLREGDEVRATGRLLQVPVGTGLLGRVVNTLGEPLDGKGPVPSTAAYPVEKLAPGIIRRRQVSQPVQTGIMAIDAMIPIGRGQRELIIGDRSTGKTTICIDTIISQAHLNRAAEAGGDKAAWIEEAFLATIPKEMPRVSAVIWFNDDKERDWRVNSTQASLDAYRRVVASTLYGGDQATDLPEEAPAVNDLDVVANVTTTVEAAPSWPQGQSAAAFIRLILRGHAKRYISKDGRPHGRPSWFETRCCAALLTMRGRAGEVGNERGFVLLTRQSSTPCAALSASS